MQPPETPLVQLAHALEAFPKYAVDYVVGFLIVLVTDVVVTSFFLGCVLLALLTTPLIAGTVFLLGYTAIRTINSIANAIGMGGQNISMAIRPPVQQPMMPQAMNLPQPPNE